MDNKTWFSQGNFGMMIHFGLYSLLAGEHNGKQGTGIDESYHGEWIQHRARIPNAEYERLATVFNPIYFDSDEWVKRAKDAGMNYMVVTSKHHDGFALFDTKWDNYNCVTGSPFKRDIIGEIANSCAKYGLKLGLYYSQEMDWHEKDGGGYGYATNDWDFPDRKEKNFTRYFEGKMKTQIKELLTNYGDICLIWCDNPVEITEAQSIELYNMIKHCQPDCLVNSRIGNGIGDYRSCGDNFINVDREQLEATPDVINARSMEYLVGSRTGLYECPATTGKSWGYVTYDTYKTAEEIKVTKDRLTSMGVNYLLNVGPDGLGRFPVPVLNIFNDLIEK